MEREPLRITHTSRSFHPVVGGVETYIRELAARLGKKGIRNSVISLNWDISAPRKKFPLHDSLDGIEINRIYGFGSPRKVIPARIPLSTLRNTDIVHVHDLRFLFETVWLLKYLYGYKLVLSTHGFLFHTSYMAFFKKVLFMYYYRTIINMFVDAVICDGKQDWEYCKKMRIKNIHLIENGVDCDRFGVVTRTPKYGAYLYFGRVDQNKGIDKLMMVLSNLKNTSWRLDIVGNGKPEILQSLRDLALRLKISDRIVWHGFVDEAALLKLMGDSQFCFFPSSYEGFGFTLVEAMAAGCVCIAQDNTSYRTLVDSGKEAYLIDFAKTPQAATAVEAILKSDEYYVTSEAARQKAQTFRWENVVDEIEKLYDSVTGRAV